MFERALTAPDRCSSVLFRGTRGVLGVLVLCGLGSAYRAVVPPSVTLVRSATSDDVVVRIRSSGRGIVDLRIELVEDGRSRLLSRRVVLGRPFPVFNPIAVREEFDVALPPERGPGAVVRATAVPSTQWNWQPAAVVREIACPARTST